MLSVPDSTLDLCVSGGEDLVWLEDIGTLRHVLESPGAFGAGVQDPSEAPAQRKGNSNAFPF